VAAKSAARRHGVNGRTSGESFFGGERRLLSGCANGRASIGRSNSNGWNRDYERVFDAAERRVHLPDWRIGTTLQVARKVLDPLPVVMLGLPLNYDPHSRWASRRSYGKSPIGRQRSSSETAEDPYVRSARVGIWLLPHCGVDLDRSMVSSTSSYHKPFDGHL
jgi:hypothetical protein